MSVQRIYYSTTRSVLAYKGFAIFHVKLSATVTFSGALRLFTIFSVLFVLNAAQDSYNYHSRGVESPWLLKHILSKSTVPKFRVRRPVVLWGVHGLTLFAVPEKYITLDITIDTDVE